ncbi:hypothetical protein ACRAVF_27110 [Bradyrhizobium oligotrophicum S58]
MSTAGQSDSVITEQAQTLADFVSIIQHPAFRIGFLDARAGRPVDHDRIMQRIIVETPPGALKRLGWSDAADDQPDMFRIDQLQAKRAKRVEIAQYRYEEGRILFIGHGVRCKAWGHPDFPPAEVMRFCKRRFEETLRTRRNEDSNHGSADSTQPTEVRP